MLSKRLAQIYQDLEAMEADKAPSRAAKILCGLGFESSSHTRYTKLVIIALILAILHEFLVNF